MSDTPSEWERYETQDGLSVERNPTEPEKAWIYIADEIPGPPGEEEFTSDASAVLSPDEVREVAARLLHGQPFGFTWADAVRLRALLGAFEPDDTVNTWLPDLADRIAALLPPRP